MNRNIKRTIVGMAAALVVGLTGDIVDIKQRFGDAFTTDPPVAVGYVDPNIVSIETQKNPDGSVGTFLEYGSETVPLKLGAEDGLQLGDAEYVWSNLDVEQRYEITDKAWNSLDNDQRISYVGGVLENMVTEEVTPLLSEQQQYELFSQHWYGMEVEEQSELITEVWPNLGVGYRHGLVRKELDQLLQE